MIVDLGGDAWWIREALGDTWQWFLDKPVEARNNAGAVAADVARAPGWWPARIPGSVIGDLHRAGELPDPYVGRNSRQAEWVAARTWVYRRDVDVPAPAAEERAVLCLDGVDPGAAVYVDGTLVGRVDGLYHPARFDITPHVGGGGTRRLAIVVDPAPPSEPQVGRTERVGIHAPRLGYGWDFCPRLIHQGVWRPIRLEIGTCHLADVSVRPEIDDDLTSARVHVRGVVETSAPTPVEVEMTVRDGARTVGTDRVYIHAPPDGPMAHRIDHVVDVDGPALWWPRGLGDQRLHTVELRVIDAGATPATWTGAVGFRHVRMVGNEGAPPGAMPYTAVVNGRRLELIGWNWAPADALYGEVEPGKIEHLIGLAVRSGARLLRVWGGGLVETPEFYDACDRAGLFVWQEFSQSSSGMQSAPREDTAYVEHLRAEARAVVPPRTRHPSLLLWGGGNELEDGAGPLDDGRSPPLRMLRDELAELDAGRAWLATSPTGPQFANRLDVIESDPDGMHDVHGPWEHQGLETHYTLYNRGRALAHTEFGVEGMTNRRSWTALIPASQRWPVGRDNPVYRHLGDWWNNAELVEECFGRRLEDADSVRRASQFLQATGLAYAVEADRRRWPRCSMTLPWQLAESYPNAWCTAVVDHRGEAKPAFHAVRRAYLPERVTACVDRVAHGHTTVAVEPWVWSEPGRASGGQVEARLLDDAGRCRAQRTWELADSITVPQRIGRFEVDLAAPESAPTPIMFWDLGWRDVDGIVVDRETVLLSTGPDLTPLLDLPRAEIMFHVEPSLDGRRWTVGVEHVTGPAVVGLQLTDDRPVTCTGWFGTDVDPRPLLPGGRREFTVDWRDDTGPRQLRLESWNTESVAVVADDGRAAGSDAHSMKEPAS